jgi:hypothetical protein
MTPTTDAIATKKIGQWLLDRKHFSPEHLHDEILDIDLDCRSGAEVVRVIAKADELCEICPNVRQSIILSVIRQVNLFYFG